MKLQTNNSLIFFCLLLASLSFSCKKNSDPTHYTISEEEKSLYLFQPGSYWIYQNTITNGIDSVYITDSPEFFQTKTILDDDKTVASIKDNYRVRFVSSLIHFCTIDPWTVDFDGFTAYNSTIPKNVGRPYEYNNYFENFPLVDSLQIENQMFYTVFVTKDSHFSDSTSQNIWATKFLSGKNIGIIQMIQSQARNYYTWNLMRYHIVK